jgi:Sap, sulfolipid-1-addressing protein
MGRSIVALLGVAVGFALSPIALVEMVLVLFSRRARVNSLVFLVAIIIPTFLVPLIGASGEQAATTSASGRTTTQAVVLLVIAALLFVLAWRNFRQRRSTSVPAVFDKIEGMGPGAVLVLAGGVTILNPKNLVILIGAGAVAGKQGLSTVELVLTLVIFTVIATSPYLVMTGYVLLGGPRAREAVQRWKDALLRNNHLIMAIVLGVLGLVLGVQGATSL